MSSPPLRRFLGGLTLTSLGVGGTIGTGIFVMAGMAARTMAGPAVILSFLIAGLACGCASLCYAELAARVPEAGSTFAYARAYLGHRGSGLIGWNLLLQYAFAAASVAQGWSHYFQDSLRAFGLPALPATGPVDLVAAGIVALTTVFLLRGLQLSAQVNNLLVALKLALFALIIGVGAFFFRSIHWAPFAPFGWGAQFPGGQPQGMLAASAVVFYAFLGFEAITVFGEDAQRPTHDIPRSILRSLAITTLVYIGMATVLTGMVRYDQLDLEAPVSAAFGQVGLPWMHRIVALGAMVSISSVLIVILLAFPRIVFAMGRAGFLPNRLSALHPQTQVPHGALITQAVVIGALAALVPLRPLGNMVVLSTLMVFIVVAAITLKARRQSGEAGFSLPIGRLAPVGSMAACGLLLAGIPKDAWLSVLGWHVLGVVIFALFLRPRH